MGQIPAASGSNLAGCFSSVLVALVLGVVGIAVLVWSAALAGPLWR